ncbi:MAG: ChrR family anti-sigma-E factor [Rhodospirillaceae bacterium]
MLSPPHHHASEAVLLSYAAGALPAGLALVVASHLALCRSCTQRVEEAEAVGGCLLDDAEEAALAPEALEQTWSRSADPDPPPLEMPSGFADLPGPLRRVLAALPDARWRMMAPGVRRINVMPGIRGGGSVNLLRIKPGVRLPHHGHSGVELTLLVHGAFTDESGHFQAGDLAEAEDDVAHQPVTEGANDCICLVATTAPLRFTSPVFRMMQPLFGL